MWAKQKILEYDSSDLHAHSNPRKRSLERETFHILHFDSKQIQMFQFSKIWKRSTVMIFVDCCSSQKKSKEKDIYIYIRNNSTYSQET